MSVRSRIFLTALLSFSFHFSFSQVNIPPDTTSIMVVDSGYEEEPTSDFFKRTDSIAHPGSIQLVLKNNKTESLKKFIQDLETEPEWIQSGLYDLDGDHKKELIINNFTGGAHCCDEYYFFKNIAPNKYQFAAKTFAGNIVINDSDEVIYDFYEQFGYFFTCYACAYEDSTGLLQPVSNIVLKYKNGKLQVVQGDNDLRSQLKDNIAQLGEQPYQELKEEYDFDNGLRKELAINMAVYYFSFGKNLPEIKALFDKDYKHPDAGKVWTAFVQQLNAIKKDNNF
ncbi:MAG: hypothetical protein JSU05_05780 [Bacteroidetes bacterium]|nr:hypothetical protein [Bacteroidota bacterium]